MKLRLYNLKAQIVLARLSTHIKRKAYKKPGYNDWLNGSIIIVIVQLTAQITVNY